MCLLKALSGPTLSTWLADKLTTNREIKSINKIELQTLFSSKLTFPSGFGYRLRFY